MTFPKDHQDLGHGTHLIDIKLYRDHLGACYLIQDGDEFAMVDCGTQHSQPQILQTLEAAGGTPEQVRWVIPTHVHLDHAGGAGQLMKVCPNATLVTHPKGHPHMVDPSKLQAGATAVYGEEPFAKDYGELIPIDASRCEAAEEGRTLPLGKRTLTIIHTPGHANHHCCVFDSASQYLFTGDTFGLGYREFGEDNPYITCTSSPVAFDPEAWMDSLDRMMALKPSAVCLTHYGLYPHPEKWVDGLRGSINRHAQIALDEEANESEGRAERLAKAVELELVDGAVAHCGIDRDAALKIFEGDIDLNSQGLGVWLIRRAKSRANAS